MIILTHTKESLMNNLKNIGVDPTGILSVHLSYKAIGEVNGRADTVLDALMTYMQGGTLVLAGHTWDNVRTPNPVMDSLYTPTCVGICTELFRKRKGVIRSLHPTHSILALGKDAQYLTQGEEKATSPCPVGGTYHKLWEQNAQILLIGVNFMRNTFIHGIEEWDAGGYNLSKEIENYYVITPEGTRLHTPQYRHKSALGSRTFTKLEPAAIQKGILTLNKFGDATSRFMLAKDIRTLTAELLQQDMTYLQTY